MVQGSRRCYKAVSSYPYLPLLNPLYPSLPNPPNARAGGVDKALTTKQQLRRDKNVEADHYAEAAEEEEFVFLYYSLMTHLSLTLSSSTLKTAKAASALAAGLREWDEGNHIVRASCIRIEIIAEDGKLQDLFFQRPIKVTAYC